MEAEQRKDMGCVCACVCVAAVYLLMGADSLSETPVTAAVCTGVSTGPEIPLQGQVPTKAPPSTITPTEGPIRQDEKQLCLISACCRTSSWPECARNPPVIVNGFAVRRGGRALGYLNGRL